MDEPALLSFGLWIKRRRKALDLTQDVLAARIGCSKELIVKIEGDARRPSREIAALLATHLQLGPDERGAFIRCARADLAPDRLPPPALSAPRAAFLPAHAAAGSTAPSGLPRGTVTFLFTDIVGSTQLWEEHPQLMGEAIARHEALLRQAVTAAGGVVFKTVGDAVCAAFGDALDALLAALAGQRALLAEAWGAAGPLRVRMALHTGVVEVREGDYAGLPLSRIARLLAAGHGGQILLSLVTTELVRDHLPPEVTLRDLGAHRLKDLSRPEQIFQLGAPDLPTEFPALQTLDAHRTNLPVQPTPLIGREHELGQVTALLARADVRLLTLTGPGGAGKTRLALQAAAELALTPSPSPIAMGEGSEGSSPPLPSQRERGSGSEGHFPDGVFFVDLAPISDPNLVVTTIAQALGVTAASERPTDQLKAALRYRHMLLLLDNYEQVLDAAALVAELLAAAPGLKVLVTSRVVLHLSGEHEYAVPPLALPPLNVGTLERSNVQTFNAELTQYAAVQLFIARAQAAKADFAVTNENALAIAEICVRLDGLPLAIELAAARVKLFPPDALLAHLSHPLALLTGGPRDLPARQQTIRGTIDWSYNLLNDEEQQLFRRLGVFVGGWTLEAAEAVCGGWELGVGNWGAAATGPTSISQLPTPILDGLAALLDHSLLVVLEPVEAEPRYGMLETLREYALERLRAAGEELQTRRQHAAFFAAWAKDIQTSLYGADPVTSDRLDRELSNFRAALDWSLARPDEDALYGLRLFGSVWELWFLRYPTEGQAIVERALACASTRHQDLATAHIYNAAARMPKGRADGAYSITLLERSLALAREYGDRPLQAEVLRHLGEAMLACDDHAAERVLEESLQISRELDDAEQEGWTMYDLGVCAELYGDLSDAEHYYQHSLVIFARLGQLYGQAFVLRKLSQLAEHRCALTEADHYLARALEFADRLGPVENFSPLIERGQLAYKRSDYQRALDLLGPGYDQARQKGYDHLAVLALMGQAACHLELGDLVTATEHCQQALALALAIPCPPSMLHGIAIISANVAVASGTHAVAARLLGCTDSYLATISYPFEHDNETDWKRLHNRALAACRAALDQETFAAAWAAGQQMALEQAIAEVLEPLKA